MGKTKDKIHDIIKESFEKNSRNINWSGMHNSATNKIMKLIEAKVRKLNVTRYKK
mgnify:CR=1 FL=1